MNQTSYIRFKISNYKHYPTKFALVFSREINHGQLVINLKISYLLYTCSQSIIYYGLLLFTKLIILLCS